MRPSNKPLAVLAVLLAVLTLAAGCGDSDDVQVRARARTKKDTTETTAAPSATTTSTAASTTTTAGQSTTTQAGQPGQPGAPPGPPPPLELVAKDVVFQPERLRAPAGQEVTIVLDNQDDGIPHNVHVKGIPGGDVMTRIEAGPVKQELKVKIDQPGTYDYMCDVHPVQMVGQLEVT